MNKCHANEALKLLQKKKTSQPNVMATLTEQDKRYFYYNYFLSFDGTPILLQLISIGIITALRAKYYPLYQHLFTKGILLNRTFCIVNILFVKAAIC